VECLSDPTCAAGWYDREEATWPPFQIGETDAGGAVGRRDPLRPTQIQSPEDSVSNRMLGCGTALVAKPEAAMVQSCRMRTAGKRLPGVAGMPD